MYELHLYFKLKISDLFLGHEKITSIEIIRNRDNKKNKLLDKQFPKKKSNTVNADRSTMRIFYINISDTDQNNTNV